MLSDLVGLGPKNPEKLDLINIDPTLVQQQTIAGNLKNAPAAFDLASLVNQFSAEELNKQLERMLPGYASLRDQVTGTIGSQLRGEIPKDVERMLERRQAEIGAQRGTAGSQFDVGNLLGTLGKTSYDIIQQGLSSAQQWISATKAPQFDFTKMFQDPNTRWRQMFDQAQANVPIRSFNNWVDTLPSVEQAAFKEFMDWIENTGRSVVEAYAGQATSGMGKPSGAGGGGGGGMMSSGGGGPTGGSFASSYGVRY